MADILKLALEEPCSKIFAVEISCSLLTISSVTKTHKRIKMCLYWHVHRCTICWKIIRNGKWKIFEADISNYNCQPSWILKILLKSELPVTSLSDFLLSKYILKGYYCKSIASKRWVLDNLIFFLVLPFSAARMVKIGPKGPYNPGFFSFT